MRTGDTTRAHKGEYMLQAPFCITDYTDTAVPYETRDGRVHCAFCGSLHPREVAALLKAGATMHLADRKYGWPHKAYLDNPWGKFYTRHLCDATPEEHDAISKALGLYIHFDPETQSVSWSALPRVPHPLAASTGTHPYPGYGSPSDYFNGA